MNILLSSEQRQPSMGNDTEHTFVDQGEFPDKIQMKLKTGMG